jgi:cytochrome c-type biogenesis protein CcmH
MQERYERLTQELRCLVCQNQTIADSNASLAQDLRREVRELMMEGKTDTEIDDFLTARYGDFVLYNPPVKPRTYLLWAAPGLLVILGLGAAVMVVIRRARTARENPTALDNDNETGTL